MELEQSPEKYPKWFRWIWVALACWALYWQGMGFLNSLKPKPPDLGDFLIPCGKTKGNHKLNSDNSKIWIIAKIL